MNIEEIKKEVVINLTMGNYIEKEERKNRRLMKYVKLLEQQLCDIAGFAWIDDAKGRRKKEIESVRKELNK